MKASFAFVFVLVLILGLTISSEVFAAAVPSPADSITDKIHEFIYKIETKIKEELIKYLEKKDL